MNELTGIWRLVATRAWDDEGNELPSPYGPMPRGIVALEKNQQMMCVLADGRSEVPAQPGSDEVREYVSYMGRYTFSDNILSTRVEGSTDASRVGSDQVREVRFDGERLFLKPPSRAKYGVTEHRELEWEKVS
ncbi:MAG: hypothetical protein ACI9DC_002149 [Gammaproteobacteria bacterium]|jgi:hypothetical protein